MVERALDLLGPQFPHPLNGDGGTMKLTGLQRCNKFSINTACDGDHVWGVWEGHCFSLLPFGTSYTLLLMLESVLVTQLCLTLATPWAVAHQAPLSMEFSRQEC